MTKLRQQYHFRDVNGKTHIWDVNKLLEASKTLKPKSIELELFRDQYNSKYWGSKESMSCAEVSEHAKLIYESDLSYPILVCPELKIIDGMHRLCRAFLEDKEFIDVVVLLELPRPDYIDVDAENLNYD